jgi:hypothetical protein
VRRLAATEPAGVERVTAPPVLCVIDDDILSLKSLTRSEGTSQARSMSVVE